MNPAENYILSKPEPYRTMLIELQAVIKHTIPEVAEAYKWNLPFYSLHDKMFCFLNFRKTFVDVGFPWGIKLEKNAKYMVAGEKHKNLRSLRFHSPEEIDIEVFQHVLLEAAQLNSRY